MDRRAGVVTGEELEVRSVSVRFGAVAALEDVSFRVAPGSIHSVIGPNGAGKSSLLNVLSGVYRPTTGEVYWNGTPLTTRRPDQITRLGVGRSFQNLGSAADRSVRDLVMLGRHALMRHGMAANGLGLRSARTEERVHRQRVEEIADFMGLGPWLDAPVSTLSYGHQKRADMARALAAEPRLLLLDEPAAGMNAGEKRGIGELVLSVVASLGMTVLLVEHDMEMVMGLSDRITVLNFGHVIAEGNPAEIQADPRVVEAYLGRVEESRS
ncbi:ABC transporter ATP-binding protein [Blastococcus sp. SYSU D00820]